MSIAVAVAINLPNGSNAVTVATCNIIETLSRPRLPQKALRHEQQ